MNTMHHITCCDLSSICHPNSPSINVPSALRSFSRHPRPLHLAHWPRRSTSKSQPSPRGIGHVQPSPPWHTHFTVQPGILPWLFSSSLSWVCLPPSLCASSQARRSVAVRNDSPKRSSDAFSSLISPPRPWHWHSNSERGEHGNLWNTKFNQLLLRNSSGSIQNLESQSQTVLDSAKAFQKV